jgi:hypothetical protein
MPCPKGEEGAALFVAVDQRPYTRQPPAPELCPVPVIIIPIGRRRPRPAVVDPRPSGCPKAVRAEKPFLIEPGLGNVVI